MSYWFLRLTTETEKCCENNNVVMWLNAVLWSGRGGGTSHSLKLPTNYKQAKKKLKETFKMQIIGLNFQRIHYKHSIHRHKGCSHVQLMCVTKTQHLTKHNNIIWNTTTSYETQQHHTKHNNIKQSSTSSHKAQQHLTKHNVTYNTTMSHKAQQHLTKHNVT